MSGFKDTEIGPIPVEWGVVPLNRAATFTRKPRGLDLSGYDAVPFIPMELVPDNRTVIEQYDLKPGSSIRSGTYCERGNILLAKITPCFENGKQGIVGDLPLEEALVLLAQAEEARTRADEELHAVLTMLGFLDWRES